MTITTASTNAQELESVDRALELWNEAAGLSLGRAPNSADLPSANGAGGAGDAALPELSVSFEKAAGSFRGLYDDERGVVIVNSAIRDAHVRAITVAHELGHAFGLQHAPDSEGATLMNADNQTVAPTAGDVAKLRALWPACAAQ